MTTTQTNVTSGTSRSIILSLSALALILTYAVIHLSIALDARDLLLMESSQSARISRTLGAASIPDITFTKGESTPVKLSVQGQGFVTSESIQKGQGVVGDTITVHIKPAPGWAFVGWRGSHYQDKPPFFSELTYTIRGGDSLIAVFEPISK